MKRVLVVVITLVSFLMLSVPTWAMPALTSPQLGIYSLEGYLAPGSSDLDPDRALLTGLWSGTGSSFDAQDELGGFQWMISGSPGDLYVSLTLNNYNGTFGGNNLPNELQMPATFSGNSADFEIAGYATEFEGYYYSFEAQGSSSQFTSLTLEIAAAPSLPMMMMMVPVPAPASFLLLGSGLVGLVGIKRRSKKS